MLLAKEYIGWNRPERRRDPAHMAALTTLEWYIPGNQRD